MKYSRLDAKVHESQHLLAQVLGQLRVQFELPPHFPAAVMDEAKQAVSSQTLPPADLTGLPFVTVDPPGSTDLDQAMYLERAANGYRVWYAIADVPSFVVPGSALDAETRRRGQTIYVPDGRIPLHPELISEDAGSLLPGRVRAAYVWEFGLDPEANVQSVALRRATVCSQAKLSYSEVQQDIDSGDAPEYLMLLKEIGLKRIELERRRGGASLNIPDQDIAHDGRHYFIVSSPPLPVEDWNAQISLMTGMAAAQLMLEAGVGILRTMPAPDAEAEAHFRRQTRALDHPWAEDLPYGEYLRGLDASDPKQLALLHAAASLFRGAGYTPFDGILPEEKLQAAIAAPYAHATAPLRRLVDRFVLVICEAQCAGTEIPQWARDALPDLPRLMATSDQLAARVDRAAFDAVQAALLSHRVGEVFDAVVISGSRPGNGQANGNNHGNGANGNGGPSGMIQLRSPAVTARCYGILEPGTTVRARLIEADIAARTIRFELDGAAPPNQS
ncbi:RNB domain-containing ribonuclease [Arthrobacter sp. GCM10027362]|uniref:RNB domain-containing ribonuclease n=1 Tax=Arthrobacter sp. GCM10027362 TaxID=3273379 RepID=UPI003627AABD